MGPVSPAFSFHPSPSLSLTHIATSIPPPVLILCYPTFPQAISCAPTRYLIMAGERGYYPDEEAQRQGYAGGSGQQPPYYQNNQHGGNNANAAYYPNYQHGGNNANTAPAQGQQAYYSNNPGSGAFDRKGPIMSLMLKNAFPFTGQTGSGGYASSWSTPVLGINALNQGYGPQGPPSATQPDTMYRHEFCGTHRSSQAQQLMDQMQSQMAQSYARMTPEQQQRHDEICRRQQAFANRHVSGNSGRW